MNSNKINVRRSFIFTPGLKPEMFPKAIASGADMVCIELEDGIAIKDKDEARKNTIEALETLEVKSGVELVVRVNCQRTKFGLLDLEAFISTKTKVKAIMLPKVKTPDEITFIDDLLTDCALDTDLHVIMETNEALESIYEIAHASKRIVALYFGGVDMAAELRVPNEYKNLIYARSKLVHAGASVGVDVIDVPYLDLEDMDGMKKEAELVRDLGFTGKGSIHPKQINMLNEIFTPSKEEIVKAKKNCRPIQ
ncbi:CoA ester lyase [Candidatus Pelagibacter sp.]|nr:CoA ester lyase [Candidatus Pelagibacter sp.]